LVGFNEIKHNFLRIWQWVTFEGGTMLSK